MAAHTATCLPARFICRQPRQQTLMGSTNAIGETHAVSHLLTPTAPGSWRQQSARQSSSRLLREAPNARTATPANTRLQWEAPNAYSAFSARTLQREAPAARTARGAHTCPEQAPHRMARILFEVVNESRLTIRILTYQHPLTFSALDPSWGCSAFRQHRLSTSALHYRAFQTSDATSAS